MRAISVLVQYCFSGLVGSRCWFVVPRQLLTIFWQVLDDLDGPLLVVLQCTTSGSELMHRRPSGVDACFTFLFSTTDPCSELLFGRLGQLLSFFWQWRPYALSCFLGRLRGPLHSF